MANYQPRRPSKKMGCGLCVEYQGRSQNRIFSRPAGQPSADPTICQRPGCLNLFSYTGGFSISAAAGGARRSTSVDIAKAPSSCHRRNFELNSTLDEHQDIATDAFEFGRTQMTLKTQI